MNTVSISTGRLVTIHYSSNRTAISRVDCIFNIALYLLRIFLKTSDIISDFLCLMITKESVISYKCVTTHEYF